jgi:hypothetical protein
LDQPCPVASTHHAATFWALRSLSHNQHRHPPCDLPLKICDLHPGAYTQSQQPQISCPGASHVLASQCRVPHCHFRPHYPASPSPDRPLQQFPSRTDPSPPNTPLLSPRNRQLQRRRRSLRRWSPFRCLPHSRRDAAILSPFTQAFPCGDTHDLWLSFCCPSPVLFTASR